MIGRVEDNNGGYASILGTADREGTMRPEGGHMREEKSELDRGVYIYAFCIIAVACGPCALNEIE